MKKRVVVGLLLVLALALVGCETERDVSVRAEEAREFVGSKVKVAWKEATGEEVSGMPTLVARDGMSESHSVMASMILSGRDMNTDLSSYHEVYLVEFKDADGAEKAAVYADGKIVLPANVGK